MFFFFNHPAPPKIYTLSLHDALPISRELHRHARRLVRIDVGQRDVHHAVGAAHRARTHRAQLMPAEVSSHWYRNGGHELRDRKSTRLNSSHTVISYAVFCLKKKKKRK